MQILLQALFIMLPAYMANLAPVIFRFLPYGNSALDFGRTFRGHRIFGDHKTWRGVILGPIAGGITILIQGVLYTSSNFFRSISLLDYTLIHNNQFAWSVLLIGMVLGFGALLGDAIKSFFKRQFGIAPGKSWPPFDQWDFIIGALLCAGWFLPLSIDHILIILISGPILHLVANVCGYILHINKKPL